MGVKMNDTIRIYFDPNDGSSAVLTSVVHRYNVVDELARIMRWGGRVIQIVVARGKDAEP